VLFAIDEEGVAHGSARSIEGIDISASIAAQAAMLDSYGGHPMAAGLRLSADRIPAFRRQLSNHVADVMGDQDPVPPLILDAEIRLKDIGTELMNSVERVAPFGPGNPIPVFSAHDLSIRSQRRIGRAGEHRALDLVDGEGSSCRVLWWNAGDDVPPPDRFDLAFHVREDTYRGEGEVQAVWVAVREHERLTARLRRPTRELRVVDLRGVEDVHQEVSRLVQTGAQAWVEGVQVAWPSRNRRELKPGDELVLWTAPPGVAELREGLSAVEPQIVHFLGFAGDLDSLEPFLERLSGALKYALRRKHGVVVVSHLSAALGHKPSTIREGIAWLAAKGHVIIHSQSESSFKILLGDSSVPDPAAKPHRLQASLSESAAFRRYLREMDGDALRRYFQALPAESRERL
jgi:single-stranded-DNA-specific exonuclease